MAMARGAIRANNEPLMGLGRCVLADVSGAAEMVDVRHAIVRAIARHSVTAVWLSLLRSITMVTTATSHKDHTTRAMGRVTAAAHHT